MRVEIAHVLKGVFAKDALRDGADRRSVTRATFYVEALREGVTVKFHAVVTGLWWRA